MGLFNFFSSKEVSTIKIDEVDFTQLDRAKFLSDYFIPRKPVLIKGGAQNWPLVNHWTKDFIIANYGDYNCTVITDSRPAYAKLKTTLEDYFLNHKGKSTLTLDFDPLKSIFFLKGLSFPNSFFSKKEINRFFFYHSVKDAGTLPHVHKDAFNILRKGVKRWIMIDADKEKSPLGYNVLLDSYKKYPSGSHAKDWFRKELPKVARKVNLLECYQTDSDIMFVPESFCHTVVNISDEVLGIVVETTRK